MKNAQRAFTLIELLVVIAIIGLLASIVLVSLGNARTKGRDAKRVADLKQLQTALELYYNDNSAYPNYVASTTGYSTAFSAIGLSPNYVAAVPNDPINTSTTYGYYYAAGYKKTGTNTFLNTGSTSDYIMATRLENATFPGAVTAFSGWNNSNLNYLTGN